MKKEQYEFCINFYKICDKYLKMKNELEIKDEWQDEQVKIYFFKKLKTELEVILLASEKIKNSSAIITDDFYYACDLALMLHTYIDCIPENKVYLLMELFTFLNKYKTKIDEKDYVNKWQMKIETEKEKENNKENPNIKIIKRKIITILLLTGAISAGAFLAQTKTCQKIIDNVYNIFLDDEQDLTLKKTK